MAINNLRLIRLAFTAPLHIHGSRADYAESLQRIHSDTLYAAIMQAWSILGIHQTLDQIKQNEGRLDFTLSSLFPFATTEGGKLVHFLPRPHKRFDNDAVEEFDDRKKLKKIEWLDIPYFEEHLKKTDGAAPQKGHIYDDAYLSKTALTFKIEKQSEDEKQQFTEKFIEVFSEPHAAIPRDIQNLDKTQTNPYTLERLRFKENCGLYFLFEGTDEVFEIIKVALNLLAEEGLGTDRSLGNGQFKYDFFDKNKPSEDLEKFKNIFSIESEYRTNLSLFMPETSDKLAAMLEDKNLNIAYELKKRGGWLTTGSFLGLHKNSVFMFAEGSVFKTNKVISGLSTNVAPPQEFGINHPVWRVGRSFFVPITF